MPAAGFRRWGTVAIAFALAACEEGKKADPAPAVSAEPVKPTATGSPYGQGRPPSSAAPTASDAPATKVASVKALIDQNPKAGRFAVEAYVVSKDECPPCPPGAACEACAGVMYVSDRSALGAGAEADPAQDVAVLAGSRHGSFDVGKQYPLKLEPRGETPKKFRLFGLK